MAERKPQKTLLIGRKIEVDKLQKAGSSNSAELIAVYGRRRIGKTYLVRSTFENKDNYMEVTGLKDGSMDDQLKLFTEALQRTFYKEVPIRQMENWKMAFELFTLEVKKRKNQEKFILFLDELPWLATRRSGLLQALDRFCNTEWNRIPNLKVILCGSAASWMLENLIHAKGGLHNRITHSIHLHPFTLLEAEEYLQSRNGNLSRNQILEIYMVLGGVAFYLNKVERGLSAAQNIQRICFSKQGELLDEYKKLFPSLFDNPEVHYKLFEEIARIRNGVSRTKLIDDMKISSGGRLNTRLGELEEGGFIARLIPYGNKERETFYRAIDEFCYFHEKWISSAPKGIFVGSSRNYWEQKRATPAWRSWAGYTFEGICLKHAEQIRSALMIDSIACETGTWRFVPSKGSKERGAQIDLLFDRSDGIITLCEIKYCDREFLIDKQYAAEIEQKIDIFRRKTKTRKHIFVAMITTHGVIRNDYYKRLVHCDLTLDDLFHD